MSKMSERLTMNGQIHKAYKVMLKIDDPKYFKDDQSIPKKIIKNCKGIAFLTIIKAGFVFSGTVGSGIIVVKTADGTWSGPSSVGVAGMGWGALIGASSTDTVIVLNTNSAVRAFSGNGQIKFGGDLSVAAGPVGRAAALDANIGDGGVAACYSYSHSRGLFAGLSLQGAILAARHSDNQKFYGVKATVKQILNGEVRPPFNDDLTNLYRILDAIHDKQDSVIDTNQPAAAAASQSGATSRPASTYQSLGPAAVSETQSPNPFSAAPAAAAAATAIAPLPPGWRELQSDTGETYYWNEDLNVTQWERPAPVAPPVAAAPPPPPTRSAASYTSPLAAAYNGSGSTAAPTIPQRQSNPSNLSGGMAQMNIHEQVIASAHQPATASTPAPGGAAHPQSIAMAAAAVSLSKSNSMRKPDEQGALPPAVPTRSYASMQKLQPVAATTTPYAAPPARVVPPNPTPAPAPAFATAPPPVAATAPPAAVPPRNYSGTTAAAVPARDYSKPAAAVPPPRDYAQPAVATPEAEPAGYAPVNPVHSYEDVSSRRIPNLDPARLDEYLSDAAFMEAFKMDRGTFNAQPVWKKQNLKKQAGLW